MQRVDRSCVRIVNARTRAVVAARARLATGLLTRLRGLLGRSSLATGEGLWLEPCSSIHMFFMRFAIDVVFVDRADVVVKIHAAVRPWRVALGGRGARAALELPVGAIAASEIRLGDRLEMEKA